MCIFFNAGHLTHYHHRLFVHIHNLKTRAVTVWGLKYHLIGKGETPDKMKQSMNKLSLGCLPTTPKVSHKKSIVFKGTDPYRILKLSTLQLTRLELNWQRRTTWMLQSCLTVVESWGKKEVDLTNLTGVRKEWTRHRTITHPVILNVGLSCLW